MLDNSLSLVKEGRDKGVLIMHAAITFVKDHPEINGKFGILANVKSSKAFEKGTWGGDFVDSMKPAPGDIEIEGKKGLDGFFSTNLDFILRQKGVRTLAVCGFLTNCCVESTMRTAYELGYEVVTLTDCCAATSIEAHEAAVKHTFPMFSLPQTANEFLKALK